ncbi:hypothetical protein ACVIW0_006087 [Bradyrhizobium sp. USDA 4454]
MQDVQSLERVEVIQQPLSFGQVVTTTGEPLNAFLLLDDVSLALSNVPFGFLQMTKLFFAMGGLKVIRHGRAPFPVQAGARSVSQPPTPTGRALAGDGGIVSRSTARAVLSRLNSVI